MKAIQRRVAAFLTLGCLWGACSGDPSTLRAVERLQTGFPRELPTLGVDLVYADPPQVLIRAFADPARGAEFAGALKGQTGLSAVRFSSHGFYSHLGPEQTDRLRQETKVRNRFLWFPVEQVVAFVREHQIRIVVGINPEEGPEAALDLVDRFRKGGAFDQIVAVELGNEPHLSHRPWVPEEYAERAAAVIRALEPSGVRFALPLTLGSEANTPTKLTDDEYTRRELAALDRLVPLAGRDDIYGVVHLYGKGVNPNTIDKLNDLVRPWAPRMRYLVTEFNIRLSLGDNAHLTTGYALSWMERTGWLMAHPDVVGLFSHGVPYHSLLCWSGGRVSTVSGMADPRFDATPGWHATPVGRMAGLFAAELWRGTLLDAVFEDRVQTWSTRLPDGERRVGVLNATDSRLERRVEVDGRTFDVTLGPRSATVFSAGGEIRRVELPKD